MLRVKIELVPFGDESMKRDIANLTIVNNLGNKNRPEYGNYDVVLDSTGKETGIRFNVDNHLRSKGIWELLYRIAEHLKK